MDNGSYWPRDEAWEIYGFALAALKTGDSCFAQTARQMSDYCLDKAPSDRVPYWDFGDPAIPETVRDSSAAAIACAAWRCFCADLPSLRECHEAGNKLLEALFSNFLQPEGKNEILAHGCVHEKKGVGMDKSTIWIDRFFLQALVDVGWTSNSLQVNSEGDHETIR